MLRLQSFTFAVLSSSFILPLVAQAGEFDERGVLVLDEDAAVSQSFSDIPERYVPPEFEACADPMIEIMPAEDALEGESFGRLNVSDGCAERWLLDVPMSDASYQLRFWMRHGAVNAYVVTIYPTESGLSDGYAYVFPSGRVTSDGWVELISNEFSIAGSAAPVVYLRIENFADESGVDLDALELAESGTFVGQDSCDPLASSNCAPDQVCMFHACAHGSPHVPPIPDESFRDDVIELLKNRIRSFYGGKRTRELYLEESLLTVDALHSASTAWEFWNTFHLAVSQLHDFHTNMLSSFEGAYVPRLNACFVEGIADFSQSVVPSDPVFPDVLVAYAGSTDGVLRPGDRLVAIDGEHPVEWALSLGDRDWKWIVASNETVYSEAIERLGGTFGDAGALVSAFANELTVVRCGSDGACGDLETISIADLPAAPAEEVHCDNRPLYHFSNSENPPSNHAIGMGFYGGLLAESEESEAVYGLVWNTLQGGGDPGSPVNTKLASYVTEWREKARGVLLDHRTGNGGTLDAVPILTTLFRPAETVAALLSPIPFAEYAGPSTNAEGIDLFEQFRTMTPVDVGDSNYDDSMPVALLLGRDGSASEYLALGLKGQPNVRIFGPHSTAGGMSTYLNFALGHGFAFQIASGDTVTREGDTLAGYGVEPDELVLPKESDLLLGKDTAYESALAWLKERLKP